MSDSEDDDRTRMPPKLQLDIEPEAPTQIAKGVWDVPPQIRAEPPTRVATRATTATSDAGLPARLPDPAPAFEGDDAPDSLSLHRGTLVGHFEITEKIGEGGFGIVYKAWDTQLHQDVAIKEYLPSDIAKRQGKGLVTIRSERHRELFGQGLAGFITEARDMVRFDNPALARAITYLEANGTAYIVMPFYRGVTLLDTVRNMAQRPDEAWIRGMLAPLMDGLAVIHAKDFYHRDIAPDNIMMLAETGRPLLLDFGAARQALGGKTQNMTAILKPGYAPLEQYGEVPGLTQGPWTDIYALAAVIYWVITGKKPPLPHGRVVKDSYEPLASMEAISTGRYSARFLAGVDRGLAVLPEKRPRSIEEFRAEMGMDRETQAGAATRTRKPGVKRPSPKLLAGFAVASLTAITAGWFLVQPPTPDPSEPNPPLGPAAASTGPIDRQSPTSNPPEAPRPAPRALEPPTPPTVEKISKPAGPTSIDEALTQLSMYSLPNLKVTPDKTSAQVTAGPSSTLLSATANEEAYLTVVARKTNPASDELVLWTSPENGATPTKTPAGKAWTIPLTALGRGKSVVGSWQMVIIANRHTTNVAVTGWKFQADRGNYARRFGSSAQPVPEGIALNGNELCPTTAPDCGFAYGVSAPIMVEVLPEPVVETAKPKSPTPKPPQAEETPIKAAPRQSSDQNNPDCTAMLGRISAGDSDPGLMNRYKQLCTR